ncbi:MAG: pyridoxamine 5'-phosphate oxidase family protein [Coriobacteriia bacterium]|nr:pyridoxamine 5'-phosphate oxidase family protein [Coriobacteriia bacterium]
MRRSDREVTDPDELLEIMRRCDVCRLALNDDDGFPYIVPLNFGISEHEGSLRLVFHSALAGHKLDLMRADSRAAFEMDCDHVLQYFEDRGYCTMSYASVMGKGRIRMMEGDEKAVALQQLMDQYHPGKNAYFNPAAMDRTAVYCLEVESMTGKRKLPK